jgi:hypothetical protein
MKVLHVFSHPDDESFGPARVISKQRRQGPQGLPGSKSVKGSTIRR